MEELLNAIWARLDGTQEVTDLAEAIVIEEDPNQPEQVGGPRIVLHAAGGPDTPGHHGGSTDKGVEIKIWGYGAAMARAVMQTADAVELALLEPLALASGSPHLRLATETGWQQAPVSDARTIHLTSTFRTRIWSVARAQKLESL